jgi:hypothetical protein
LSVVAVIAPAFADAVAAASAAFWRQLQVVLHS